MNDLHLNINWCR